MRRLRTLGLLLAGVAAAFLLGQADLRLAALLPAQVRPPVTPFTAYSFTGSLVVLMALGPVVFLIVYGGKTPGGLRDQNLPWPALLAIVLSVCAFVPLVLAVAVLSFVHPQDAAGETRASVLVTFVVSVVVALAVERAYPDKFPNPADKATWYLGMAGVPPGLVAVI